MIALGDRGDIASVIDEWCDDIGRRLGHCDIHVRTCRRVTLMFVAWAKVRSAEQIDPVSVMRWLRHRGEQVSRKTALNEMSVLRTFVDWLVASGHLTHNRISGIRLPRAPKSRGCRPFTIEEAAAIILAAEEAEGSSGRSRIHGPLRSTFYRVMLFTGLRFSELRVQEWQDVSLAERWLRVTHDKARRHDVIPISQQTADALVRWSRWSKGPLVFPHVPCNKSLERDMESAGVEVVAGNWHRFRKCLITTLRKKGATLNQVCRVARHLDPKTTMLSYDWHELDELRQVTALFPQLCEVNTFSVDRCRHFPDKTAGDVHEHPSTNPEPFDVPPSASQNVAASTSAGGTSIGSSIVRDQRTWRDSTPSVAELVPWALLVFELMRKGASCPARSAESASSSSSSDLRPSPES